MKSGEFSLRLTPKKELYNRPAVVNRIFFGKASAELQA